MAEDQSIKSVPDYFNRFNPDILKLLPLDAEVVLEIGCGAGKLAELYRRVNPGAQWIGVEVDRDSADFAWKSKRVDRVLEVDVEDFLALNEKLDEPCDVLVCGDVLEHLRNPDQVLKRIALEVNPGGLMIACIPNVGHWTVIRDLLKGQWRYADEGLLDRAHLRYFTLEGVKTLFAQAGLHVFEVRGRMLGNEGFEEWLASSGLKPSKAEIGHMKAYQFVVRAVKPTAKQDSKGGYVIGLPSGDPRIDKLHIHAITAEECCARPRIREPSAALNTIPGVRCTAGLDGSYPAPGDIMIQQRFRALDLGCQRLHLEAGWLLIAEIDDDPAGLFVDPDERDKQARIVRIDHKLADIYGWLSACHAVQVTTDRLAETVRQWNPNVMVFPNQLAELPPWEDKVSAEVRIFFGAQNRMADWKPIMPALNRIIRDHQADYLTFHVVHDKAFYDALETGKKAFHPFLPYDQYIQVLRGCDIALLPLEPGRFNEHKSDIKFLECAANGVAVMAGQTVYRSVLEDGTNGDPRGWHYADAEDFEHYLATIIRLPEKRVRLARNAYAYVRDHRLLSLHYRARHTWYLSLLSDRERLHAELLERVPELKGAIS